MAGDELFAGTPVVQGGRIIGGRSYPHLPHGSEEPRDRSERQAARMGSHLSQSSRGPCLAFRHTAAGNNFKAGNLLLKI